MHDALPATADDAHSTGPLSRRARREQERSNAGSGRVPAQVVLTTSSPGEDIESGDDDLSVITPPPRPAPRAAAFKGLGILEHHVSIEDDAEPPGATGPPATTARAAKPAGTDVRLPASMQLEPAHWPSNDGFSTSPPPIPGTAVKKAPAPVVEPPSVAEPEPIAEPAAIIETPPEPAETPPARATVEPPAAAVSKPPAEPGAALSRPGPVRRATPRIGSRTSTRTKPIPAKQKVPGRGGARRLTAALYLLPILGTSIALAAVLFGAIILISHPIAGAIMLILAAAVLGAVVLTATEVNRAIPGPLIGAELSQAEHPDLWVAIGAAADELGVQTPVRAVVDGAARIGLVHRPAGNELVIGLPLLLGLSEPELSALLIHELAHDAAPDGAVHRMGERIDATVRQLSADRRWSRRPARALMWWYGRCYLRLAMAANRRHELRADDRAAALTSPKIVADAITRTELIRERWQILVTQYVPFSAIARRRAALGDGLRSLLAVPIPEPLTQPPEANEPDATPAAEADTSTGMLPSYDAHLSPAERAARLSKASGRAPRRSEPHHAHGHTDPPATALLAGGESQIAALEHAVLPDDDPDADWQTIVQIAAETQAQERTAHLAWAMRDLHRGAPVTLSNVLSAISAGNGPQVVAPLLAPGLPAEQRPAAAQKMLEQLLTSFVVTVLLRTGRALYEVAWPGGVRLLRRKGDAWIAWDGDEPIRSGTADPAGTSALERWLRDVHVDLDAVAQPSAGPPLHLLSAFSDLELMLPFESRPVDLLIYRTGVLLAPIEVPTPAGRLAHQATQTLRRQTPAAVAEQRIGSLARQLGELPQKLPGGWWIEVDTVSSSQIRERRNGTEIQLRLAGGASASLRTTGRTNTGGTPLEDLARMLPAHP